MLCIHSSINRCDFTLPKSFEGLSVTAIFNGIPVPLTDGKCIIPALKNGNCIFGVYAYKKNGDVMETVTEENFGNTREHSGFSGTSSRINTGNPAANASKRTGVKPNIFIETRVSFSK